MKPRPAKETREGQPFLQPDIDPVTGEVYSAPSPADDLVRFPVVEFPGLLPDEELPGKYYFVDGRKWNGIFTHNLPDPEPVIPPEKFIPDTRPNAPPFEFRLIDPASEQDRFYSRLLSSYQSDLARSESGRLSSNVTKNHGADGNASSLTKFPTLPPVVGVKFFRSNAVVIRAAGVQSGGGPKGEIVEVSSEQIKNAITVLTDSDKQLNSIIHLTYPDTFPWDGRIVKAHLKRFMLVLRERLGGDFDYFAVIEYQGRGAPHIHLAIEQDVKALGEVVTLHREQGVRRSPTFDTVLSENRWAFETWKGIIARHKDGFITYNGEKLEWSGVTDNDLAAMDKAFGTYNAGVCWEVMRDKDGAKKYLVKELSEKKHYQHLIPEGFTHPGRHFLYNHDFPNREAVEMPVDQESLRRAAETCGWRDGKGRKLSPNINKPLYKRLWNISQKLLDRLVEMGFKPTFDGVLGKIREYWDYRVNHFVPSQIVLGVHDVGKWRLIESELKAKEHWKERVKRFISEDAWQFILTDGAMGAVGAAA